jgi:hypothetical protein
MPNENLRDQVAHNAACLFISQAAVRAARDAENRCRLRYEGLAAKGARAALCEGEQAHLTRMSAELRVAHANTRVAVGINNALLETQHQLLDDLRSADKDFAQRADAQMRAAFEHAHAAGAAR